MPAINALSLHWVTDEEGLAALEKPWKQALAESRNPNIFLTYEWNAVWWKHFKEGRRLRIAVVERDRKPALIAPLVLEKTGVTPTLKFLGRPASDYNDFILRPRDADLIAGLLDELRANKEWDRALLGGIREDSAIFPVLSKWRENKPLWIRSHSLEKAPYVPIERSWKEYSLNLSKNHLRNISRQKRRLAESGKPEFTLCADKTRVRELVHGLILEKRRQYAGKPGLCTYEGEHWSAFYEEIAEIFHDKKWLDLSFLALDGKVIASEMSFVYENRILSHMAAFDPQFARLSPGRLLFGFLIEQAHEAGRQEYDLMCGAENYKYDWTDRDRNIHRFEIYRPSVKGVYSLAARLTRRKSP